MTLRIALVPARDLAMVLTAAVRTIPALILAAALTSADARGADSLADTLKGKWAGDVEAFKKANPNQKDEVGETLHRTIEYEFTERQVFFGTAFDLGPKRELYYRVVRVEKDRITIEAGPNEKDVTRGIGAKPNKKVQKGVVVFSDKDHIQITWEAATPDRPAPAKGLFLKRAK